MSEELKPCPFCGGEARIVQASGRMLFCVVCDDCDASGGHYFTEEDAATAWNDRAERTCRRVSEFVTYKNGLTGEYREVCSACGRALRAGSVYRYCPNCGARVVRTND